MRATTPRRRCAPRFAPSQRNSRRGSGEPCRDAAARRSGQQSGAGYDAVIHNAGVGYQQRYGKTIDGLSHVFQINVLAPYLLTALVTPPSAHLLKLRHAYGRARRRSTIAMDGASVERRASLFGQQAVRRRAGLRGGAAVARRIVQRAGAGMGRHQNGRPRRFPTISRSRGHAGVAGRSATSRPRQSAANISTISSPAACIAAARRRNCRPISSVIAPN